MHVVVAGSSGFLGQHLIADLATRGHDVTVLVRRPTATTGESHWDPESGRLDRELIERCDAVVNLAGSPTLGNPHSTKWASDLRRSRLKTTGLLADAIGASQRKPAFLAGNGISYYGDHGSEVLTEDSPSVGDALLTSVTRQWQEVALPAADAGARVCILRTAPVLDRRSAPLSLQLPLFKLGLGARLGDGSQYFPVISLRDWVGGVTFLIEHESASGPFNLCTPITPTNAEFTTALADRVHRKVLLSAPAFVLRRAAGPMASELLGSLNTRPEGLIRAGFCFQDGTVGEVLDQALGIG